MICLNTQKQILEYQNCSFILKYLLSSKLRDIHAEPNLVLTPESCRDRQILDQPQSLSISADLAWLEDWWLPTYLVALQQEEYRTFLPSSFSAFGTSYHNHHVEDCRKKSLASCRNQASTWASVFEPWAPADP